MAKCNTQANNMAATTNNWMAPGASDPGHYMKDRGVTTPMVVKEFVKRRVAPLQRHSRPMWTLLNSQDCRMWGSGKPLRFEH